MKKWKNVSHSVLSSLRPHGQSSPRFLCPWHSPGKHTGVGSHSLLQGLFPTQGSDLGLQHCRQILYRMSLKLSHVPAVAWVLCLGEHWVEGVLKRCKYTSLQKTIAFLGKKKWKKKHYVLEHLQAIFIRSLPCLWSFKSQDMVLLWLLGNIWPFNPERVVFYPFWAWLLSSHGFSLSHRGHTDWACFQG